MYKTLPQLSPATLQTFDTLVQQVSFTNDNIRLGANGTEKVSKYFYSRWFDWTDTQRAEFKHCFSATASKPLVGWFLTFPANTGFLDLMTYWQDKVMAGVVVAYALENNQKIWLNGKEVTLDRGQGLEFSLKVLHEVKSSPIQQKWACVMQLDKE